MLQRILGRSPARRTAGELYGRVVAAARQPELYRNLGGIDTPEGRFELVALHLFLALETLRASAQPSNDIAQRTIEAFVTDMDDCHREMGVGDLTVPKKVKLAAAAFYERAGVYRAALAADDETLATALHTYVMLGRGEVSDAGALARRVRATLIDLKGLPAHRIFADAGRA